MQQNETTESIESIQQPTDPVSILMECQKVQGIEAFDFSKESRPNSKKVDQHPRYKPPALKVVKRDSSKLIAGKTDQSDTNRSKERLGSKYTSLEMSESRKYKHTVLAMALNQSKENTMSL